MKKTVSMIFMLLNERSLMVLVLMMAFVSFQSCCLHAGSAGNACRLSKPRVLLASEASKNSSLGTVGKLGAAGAVTISESYEESISQKPEKMGIEESLQITPLTTAKKLPIGIKSIGTTLMAGPNLSFFKSKEDFGTLKHKGKPGIGFQAGVGSQIQFTDKFVFAPAIMIKNNKAGEEVTSTYTGGGEPGTSQKYTDNYSFTWISIPLHAEFTMADNLDLIVGPEVNFLLAASVKSEGQKTDLKSSAVKTGVGAQLGARYSFGKQGAFALELIYDHRISRLNKKTMDYGGGGGYDVPGTYMKSFQFSFVCEICKLLAGG